MGDLFIYPSDISNNWGGGEQPGGQGSALTKARAAAAAGVTARVGGAGAATWGARGHQREQLEVVAGGWG